jgi:hypothetical protein
MMDCTRLDAALPDYLAGRLAAADADALEAHAGDCPRCGPMLETATRLDAALPSEIAPPDIVRARVLAAIRPGLRATRLPRWVIPAVAAAMALFVVNLSVPRRKGAQAPLRTPSSAIAIERADAQFKALDAAEQELTAALRASPDDASLRDALSRLAAQRKALQALVKEYDS